MEKILVNRIRCKQCGDVLESKERHDFKVCKCGCCDIDGGTIYLKRGFTDSPDDFEEMSEYIE